MKNVMIAVVMFIAFGMAACGGGNGNKPTVDTVVNPADNTNAVQSDSTKPANAPGVDTVGGGQSTSSGAKDTSIKK